jgi:hypothetical protein
MARSRWNAQSSEDRVNECLEIIEERTKSLLEHEAKGDKERTEIVKQQIDNWFDVIRCVYISKYKGRIKNAK